MNGICHIQSLLDKRQAYVSQQLMVLRDAGLVVDRRDGLNVFYRLADTAAADALAVILGPAEDREACQETACPHCETSQASATEAP